MRLLALILSALSLVCSAAIIPTHRIPAE